MNFQFRPFPILITVVVVAIAALGVAINGSDFRIYVNGSNSPGGTPSSLATARVVQTPGNKNFLTGTNGYTDSIALTPGDELTISKSGFRKMILTTVDFTNTIYRIGVTLHGSTATNPTVEGKVINNGKPMANVTVTCKECPSQTSTTQTNILGHYSIPTGSASNQYTLRYLQNSIEIAHFVIEPEAKDDHAKIDVVFDDSQKGLWPF